MSQPVNRLRSMKACRFTPTLALPVALCLLAFGSARLFAQDAAEALKLPRGLTEVVRLVGSGVGDDVVISYIQNTPVPKPTVSDLIELHRAKVPSAVIVALLSKPQKPIVEAAPAAAPVPETKPAPAVQQVISAPAPSTVQPVYVQRDPVVIYSSPGYYRGSGWDWAGFGIGLGLGHIFSHHGHYGHHGYGHHGYGHHGYGHHGGLRVYGGRHH